MVISSHDMVWIVTFHTNTSNKVAVLSIMMRTNHVRNPLIFMTFQKNLNPEKDAPKNFVASSYKISLNF